MFLHLFGGDHVIIHRLSAGQQVDLGGGTRLREDIRGLLGLLLRHILAIEDGDEAGILVLRGLGQPGEQGVQVLIRTEQLVLLQGQIVPLFDGKPPKSESRAA